MRNQQMRTVPNYLIANLSASDIMLTLTVPSLCVTRLSVDWILGQLACTMFTYMQVVSGANSMLTMMIISLDRYLAICRPWRGGKRLTTRAAGIMITVIWIVTSAYFIPLGMAEVVRQITQFDRTYSFCYLQWPDGFRETLYIGGMVILFFIIPVTITTINYFFIWAKVRESSVKLPIKMSEKSAKIQMRLTKMFITVVVLFVSMWLPFFIISVMIIHSELITSTIFTSTTILVIANTAFNPLVYGYFNENFRKAFKTMLRCEKHELTSGPSITVSWIK